jgi:hypothetical protein
MFSISNLEESDALDLIALLLEQSIPPTAIAKALDIEPDFVQGMLAQIRVQRYGTAEISEAMVYLMWKAYDSAVEMLHTGSPANRLRTINMILSRTVGMASRQDPEEFARLRSEMTRLIEDAKTVEQSDSFQPGEFVLGVVEGDG